METYVRWLIILGLLNFLTLVIFSAIELFKKIRQKLQRKRILKAQKKAKLNQILVDISNRPCKPIEIEKYQMDRQNLKLALKKQNKKVVKPKKKKSSSMRKTSNQTTKCKRSGSYNQNCSRLSDQSIKRAEKYLKQIKKRCSVEYVIARHELEQIKNHRERSNLIDVTKNVEEISGNGQNLIVQIDEVQNVENRSLSQGRSFFDNGELYKVSF